MSLSKNSLSPLYFCPWEGTLKTILIHKDGGVVMKKSSIKVLEKPQTNVNHLWGKH